MNKTSSQPVPPFPLHAKYVPAVLGAKGGEADHDGSDVDSDEKKGPKPKRKAKKPKAKAKKPTKATKNKSEEQSDWQYGKIRNLFIKNHRATGLSYQEAVKLWDNSDEKAQILSLVPLPELKKRRFLEFHIATNPWLEKLSGSSSA